MKYFTPYLFWSVTGLAVLNTTASFSAPIAHHQAVATATSHVVGKVQTLVSTLYSDGIGGVTEPTPKFDAEAYAQTIEGYEQEEEQTFGYFTMAGRHPSPRHRTQGRMNKMTQGSMGTLPLLKTEHTGVWAQPFGQVSEQNSTSGDSGHRTHTVGMVLGIDHKITPNFVIGGGIGSATSASDLTLNGSKSKIDDRFASVIGAYKKDNWYINVLVTASYNRFKSGRVIDAATVATNAHDGYQLAPSLSAGYGVKLSNTWTCTPNISTTFIQSHENKYVESGAGANNQTVRARSSSQTYTQAGMNFVTKKTHKHAHAIYTLGAAFVVKAPVKQGAINGTVGGNGFNIIPNQKTTFYGAFKASTQLRLADHWSASLHYSGEFGKRYQAHEGALRIGKRL